MATKEEAYAAYKKINPNKEPSQTDIDNGMKLGTDIYATSYAKITGKPNTQTATAQQQGQVTVPTTAQGRYDQASQELNNLVDNKGAAAEFLRQIVTMKAEKKAPILKEKKKGRDKIAKMSINDKAYEGLRPDDAIAAMGQDTSLELNNLQYLSEQLQNQQANTQSTLDSLNEYMKNKGSLLAGQMDQASSEMSSRGSGSGRIGADKESQFKDDISGLILKLDKREIGWGTAFDYIKTNYPEKSNEQIDQAMGGGQVPMSTPSGQPAYWGRGTIEYDPNYTKADTKSSNGPSWLNR